MAGFASSLPRLTSTLTLRRLELQKLTTRLVILQIASS